MTKDDLNKIITISDLEVFRVRILNDFKELLKSNKSEPLFYSPKEFSRRTGIPYSTVVLYCKLGKLKARQEIIKGSWLIDASEIERYKREAEENIQ